MACTGFGSVLLRVPVCQYHLALPSAGGLAWGFDEPSYPVLDDVARYRNHAAGIPVTRCEMSCIADLFDVRVSHLCHGLVLA